MKTLDLHGVYHDEVDRLVENFILMNDCPLEIITGNSSRMQELVKEVLEKYHFKYRYKNYVNLGALIIYDY
jgi:hypothetical protein